MEAETRQFYICRDVGLPGGCVNLVNPKPYPVRQGRELIEGLFYRHFPLRMCKKGNADALCVACPAKLFAPWRGLKRGSAAVKRISEWFIRPQFEAAAAQDHESKKPIFLSQFDLAMLSVHYIQKGLLFKKLPEEEPSSTSSILISSLLASLHDSLAFTLNHFYPLAGQLSTRVLDDDDEHSSLIFIDPIKGPGAKLIHASLDMTVSDILSPVDVPRVVVHSFFDHDRAVNHDGHRRPLLSVQVTELIDGIFIGCSMNHVVADGTSFWHFFNSWSEIHMMMIRSAANINYDSISRPPMIKPRWSVDGTDPSSIKLPFVDPDEFVRPYEAPPLRERIFHFSSRSMAAIKAKANDGILDHMNRMMMISSLQALSALVWRCIIRARGLRSEDETSCRLAINNRPRLEPPVSRDYFGNLVQTVRGVTTAGELLQHDLGWAANMLHQAVVRHDDKAVRDTCEAWVKMKSPLVYQLGTYFEPEKSVMMGSSPRFDMYGNEFGLGKAVAVLSGYGNKFDGKVTTYPGFEGRGSVDLEICLSPSSMAALESDDEFMLNVNV
ncbi:hypothetical protein Dimus_028001 [Dionaea muscipula]